jgi:hypothetical protein
MICQECGQCFTSASGGQVERVAVPLSAVFDNFSKWTRRKRTRSRSRSRRRTHYMRRTITRRITMMMRQMTEEQVHGQARKDEDQQVESKDEVLLANHFVLSGGHKTAYGHSELISFVLEFGFIQLPLWNKLLYFI